MPREPSVRYQLLQAKLACGMINNYQFRKELNGNRSPWPTVKVPYSEIDASAITLDRLLSSLYFMTSKDHIHRAAMTVPYALNHKYRTKIERHSKTYLRLEEFVSAFNAHRGGIAKIVHDGERSSVIINRRN